MASRLGWTRRSTLQGIVGAGAAWSLTGCRPAPTEPLRFGVHPWPGYALLGLAADLDAVVSDQIKYVQTPSASASLRGLANGSLEGAGLTLDEVLLAREQGTPLTVVAVVDQSMGADVVLAPVEVTELSQLKGLRIGAEKTAVGAVMLESALRAGGLTLNDVRVVNVSIDAHEQAVIDGRVDAIVTYEPVKTRLLERGWREVFSSAAIPGKIIDVLAVHSAVAARNPDAVRALTTAFFTGRNAWVRAPNTHAKSLARWLAIDESEVSGTFDGLALPSLEDNREWLQGNSRRLDGVARELAQVLRASGLLLRDPDFSSLADGRFLD